MWRGLCLVASLAVAMMITSCGPPSPSDAALPDSPVACKSRTPGPSPTPKPTPTATKLAWRAEERADGSVRMTVGDVDKAPKDPGSVRTTGHDRPSPESECDTVKITKVKGWWCTTTAEKLVVAGEIVVGGAEPRAEIKSSGVTTQCHGRPGRMRQRYFLVRDSWSGWRNYIADRRTEWTSAAKQSSGPVSASCPLPGGRVGTYNYALMVFFEIEGIEVGESRAMSARIRTDCGTGVS